MSKYSYVRLSSLLFAVFVSFILISTVTGSAFAFTSSADGYLLYESFDSLNNGWTVSDAPTLKGGDPIYEGWISVTMKNWLDYSDSGHRESFTLANGRFMIADADEWWDMQSINSRMFDSTLQSPLISVPSDTREFNLSFSSHYQQEDNQKRSLTVKTFDGDLEFLEVQSIPIVPNRDASNQSLLVPITLDHPNTSFIQIEWRLYDAKDDWYWAIDDVIVKFLKDYEDDVGVTTFEHIWKMPSADENKSIVSYRWSKLPPSGWSVINQPLALAGSTEFSGWTFMDKDAWLNVSDGNGADRHKFTLGNGIVAIADPDEWDDRNHSGVDKFHSSLISPTYKSHPDDKHVLVTFSNQYKQEDDQIGELYVNFYNDSYDPILIDQSYQVKYTEDKINTIESHLFPIPSGASSFRVVWELSGSNDWYWVIDDVYIGTGFEKTLYEDFSEISLSYNYNNAHDDNWRVYNNPNDLKGDPNFSGWVLLDSTSDWIEKASAEDQDRSRFTLAGSNHILVADPDEWYDLGHTGVSKFESAVVSPTYPIPSGALKAHILFNSHYKQEGDQGGIFRVLTVNEEPVFHDIFSKTELNTKKHYTIDLSEYPDNNGLIFRWMLYDAQNDWYWAISDLEMYFELPEIDCSNYMISDPDRNIMSHELESSTSNTISGSCIFDSITKLVDEGDFKVFVDTTTSDASHLPSGFERPPSHIDYPVKHPTDDVNLNKELNHLMHGFHIILTNLHDAYSLYNTMILEPVSYSTRTDAPEYLIHELKFGVHTTEILIYKITSGEFLNYNQAYTNFDNWYENKPTLTPEGKPKFSKTDEFAHLKGGPAMLSDVYLNSINHNLKEYKQLLERMHDLLESS